MKRLLAVLAVIVVIPLALGQGCIPGLKTAKPTPIPEQSPDAVSTENPPNASKPTELSEEELDKMLPPPPPSYKTRKSIDGKMALPVTPKEMLEKDKINEAAVKFANEIPNVKHVKTCFSKMFGGWYLDVFVTKGKKIIKQHYSWNPVTREWDISLAPKEVPEDKLEYHLKGEVRDERCSVLK